LFYVSGGFDHEVCENCGFGRCGCGCFVAGFVPGLSPSLPPLLWIVLLLQLQQLRFERMR
jgi:hypothetical protein